MVKQRNPYRHLLFVLAIVLFAVSGCQAIPTNEPVQTTTEPEIESEPIDLPDPVLESDMSLEAAIKRRRSIRDFKDTALPLKSVGQILWAAQGITEPVRGFRAVPSAGALYPLEVYLVAGRVEGLPAGVYRYLPATHQLVLVTEGDRRSQVSAAALSQQWVIDAPASIFIAGVHARTEAVYGNRARIYVYMEAGHAGQNISLQAVSLGMGSVPIGAFHDREIAAAIGMPADESPLYLFPIGFPDTN